MVIGSTWRQVKASGISRYHEKKNVCEDCTDNIRLLNVLQSSRETNQDLPRLAIERPFGDRVSLHSYHIQVFFRLYRTDSLWCPQHHPDTQYRGVQIISGLTRPTCSFVSRSRRMLVEQPDAACPQRHVLFRLVDFSFWWISIAF